MAQSRKEQLILELQEQRQGLTDHYRSLKAGLEPGHQLRLSLRKHPLRWTLGAAGSAFFLTRFLRGRKVIYKTPKSRGGLIFRTLKFAFFLARPALTTIALRKAQDHLQDHLNRTHDNSMLGGSPQK